MRLAFASPFATLAHSTSGREISVDALARHLEQRGVPTAVFGQVPPEAASAGQPFRIDRAAGYATYGAAKPLDAYAAFLDDWRPDIAILPLAPPCIPLAALGLARGVKAAFHVTNAEPSHLATNLVDRPDITLIANSPFTARRLETMLGVSPPVVLPLIEPERYHVEPVGDSVLLVNPSLQKGVEIFFRLAAAHPDVRFLAVESWDVHEAWRMVLANRARALGNVALWQADADMREAYARARLVLMPSIHEETFGRVVAEAQVSGIPALVSDRGALSETVGGGGLAVPLDAGMDAWSAALSAIWDDADRTRAFAAAAKVEAARPERAPEHILSGLLDILTRLMAAGR